jgi:hypothetical protein
MLEHKYLILGSYCACWNCGSAEKPEHSLVHGDRENRALSRSGHDCENQALSCSGQDRENQALSCIGRDGTNNSFPAGVIQRHDPSS